MKVVKHKNDGRFIVNMHALHNANIIHKLFPQEMYSLPPVTTNREEFHHTLAAQLREAKKGKGKHPEGEKERIEVQARQEGMNQTNNVLEDNELADSVAAAGIIVDLENIQF